MKIKTLSTTKRLLLSSGIGIAFVLLISSLGGIHAMSPVAEFFLLPGAYLSSLAGYGAHDLEGLLLYIVGNMTFYVMIVSLVLWLAATVEKAPN